MPALPRPDPFKLKSVPSTENGSTSFRKLVAGSSMGQTLRMAEIFLEEISGVQAIHSTTTRDTSRCRKYLGLDLCRSVVSNQSAQSE
jgi:hypothetical protein